MDELVKMVATRTGLPEDQAKAAAQAVIDYLKKNLPAPVAGQIDALLAGGDITKQAGDALSGPGGMFGKKK